MLLDKQAFSETLNNIRHGKGIKQKEITNNLMCRTTYSKIERGIIIPNVFNFYNILSRLDIEFEEFIYTIIILLMEKMKLLMNLKRLELILI